MDKKVGIILGIFTLVIFIGGIFFVSKSPSSTNTQNKVYPDLIKETTHTKGNDSAQVTLVEFGDYQCPACLTAHPYVLDILKEYPDSVRFAYHHFPLTKHENAVSASEAAEAAAAQNKFWEMHDILYQRQDEWANLSNPQEKYISYAQELGLDTAKFSLELKDRVYKDKVQQDSNDGIKAEVNATPTFYINGVKFTGNFPGLKEAVTNQFK